MCGIGGILRTDGQPIPEEWLNAIDARIAYRGPDGCGRFRDRVEIEVEEKGKDGAITKVNRVVEVAFVHRRLAIIDLEEGEQPMVSERGRNDAEGLVAVVFNGCIYNHRELRKELEGKGHRFVTDHSDTEVLIHGWREWREKLPEHLEGMYAFAVWDRANASLFLARDWFGEKPLFYRQTPDWRIGERTTPTFFAFSSDCDPLENIPTLLTFSERTELNHWTANYLRRGFIWESTAPRDSTTASYSFAPGKSQVINPVSETSILHDQKACLDELRPSVGTTEFERLIEQAVARRLEADVPLGCFLSGGVDSSLITHFAKQHKRDLQTFSIRMPDPRYDESNHAESVAKHVGTRHTTLDVAVRPAEDLLTLIGIMGQPFGDSSILPSYWISKAARQHVKVAIAGDGGDEMFVGYERYQAARSLHRFWRVLQFAPVGAFHRFHPKSRLNKLARLRDMSRDYPILGVSAMQSVFTIAAIEGLVGPPNDWEGTNASVEDATAAVRWLDVVTYLSYDLLRKVDTASMACGLEVRCPFLDRDLARAALSMPVEQLMPGGQRKGLLRAIARKYLPREIVDRPKMGFAIPIGEWFRNDDLPHKGSGMKTMLLDHLNSAEPFGPIQLNRKAVQRFIDEHMSGKRDHGQKLFTLLTLSMWGRNQSIQHTAQRTHEEEKKKGNRQ